MWIIQFTYFFSLEEFEIEFAIILTINNKMRITLFRSTIGLCDLCFDASCKLCMIIHNIICQVVNNI